MGNQVVRRDERARRFAGEIFALPLHLQMRVRQALAGFLVVMGLRVFGLLAARVVFARDLPVQPLEPPFGFT